MKQDKISLAGIKKYLSLYEGTGWYWFLMLLRPCMAVFINTVNALLYKNIINAVAASDRDLFYKSLWLAVIVFVASLSNCLIVYLHMYNTRQIMYRLRLRVMTHLLKLPMSYFEHHHTADSIQKLCFNVEKIKDSLANRHSMIIGPVIQGVSAIILIIILDWRIGLMVFILSLLSVQINLILTKSLRKITLRIQKLLTFCTESLNDILAGIDVIKMFPGAGMIVERYNRYNEEVAAENVKRFRCLSNVQAAEWSLGFLGNIVILLIGVFMSFRGLVDFGTVVAVLSLQGMVSLFLSSIGSAQSNLIEAFVLADMVFEVLDEPVESKRYPCLETEAKGCGIDMENVVFSYDGLENVLDGISISVDKGKMAALVGESGGGKSTVIKLVLGFYNLSGGGMGILGKSLADYTLDELRKNIAYVPQDAYLFTTSIKENIRYGRLEATDDEIIAAAKRAYAHDFIMTLPNGYDTMVGERGESLSGGQRQRVAIARAFIKNAPILLLDEATSALDSESEQLVQNGIEALMGGRTTLVVAHRLSTIEKADMIYVINSGKVSEKGKHSELMNQRGVYKKLVDLSNANTNGKKSPL